MKVNIQMAEKMAKEKNIMKMENWISKEII